MYISGKSRGHMIQLICTLSWTTNHPSQYEVTRSIYYIDSLVKFNYGSAASNVAVTFVNINGQILLISWKHSILRFNKCFKVATLFNHCLHRFLNIRRGKLGYRVVTS